MKKYKREVLEEYSSKARQILNKSKISNEELYNILYQSGHNTISMWKNDRDNLVEYLIAMLER
jgi:hypothetical protein